MMINTTTVTPTEGSPLVETATPLIVAMKTLDVSSVTINSADLTTGQVIVSYTDNPSQKVDPSITNHINALVVLIARQITQKLTIADDFCGIIITVTVTEKSASVEYKIIRETTRFTFSGIVLPDEAADGDDSTAETNTATTPAEEDTAVTPTP